MFHDPIHHAHVFRETAACGLETRSGAGPAVKLALRIKFAFAKEAPAAWNVMVYRNTVTRGKLGNGGAGSDDHASDLVAEYPGGSDQSVLNFFNVRATNAAGVDANKDFSIRGPWHG
jgi:hypothetical protein